jgi:LysM repeat protein
MGEFMRNRYEKQEWTKLIKPLAVILLIFGTLVSTTMVVNAQEKEAVVYLVRQGDTLSEIAISFDTTVQTLLRANPDISNANIIYVGQEITIPAADRPPRTAVLAPTNGTAGSEVHLRGSGFNPYRQLQILFGPENSEAAQIYETQATADGKLSLDIIVAEFAETSDEWIAAIRPLNNPEEYLEKSNAFLVTDEGKPFNTQQTILYLIDLEDNGVSGELIGCNDSLVPVTVKISETESPIETTLQKLLEINSRLYGQSGLYNSLYLSDLALDRIDVHDHKAYVYLQGEKKLGGTCDVPRFRYQLVETVNQFSQVSDVKVYINGELEFAESEIESDRSDRQVYTVQDGDTLSHVAVSFNTSIEALMNANPDIDRPSLIIVGQRLAIPSTDDDNPNLTILPTNGEPGTTVTIKADNLMPEAEFIVGVGRVNSEYDPLKDIQTNNNGEANSEVEIPEFAEAGEYWVVVLSSENTNMKVISNLFLVE